ncbi:peroxisome assembly protein 12-like isoform X2 [Oscarella lobularis]|uniref:peroxisome assembly protein 12-like isoform X2 n=1 Tax=Oscarella lobularis TaxID=121494 RepID=UPI0033140448
MGEQFAANLNRRLAPSRPSFFELAAQEGMQSALNPAFQYAFRIVANYYPASFGWLYRFGDEVGALFDAALQFYYIEHKNASFSELFYGMKRMASGANEVTPLSRRHKIMSLLILVGVSYIKTKLDRLYQEKSQSVSDQSESRHFLLEWYLKLYPAIHFLWEAHLFVYRFAYLFNSSNYWSPLLKLAGVELIRITPDNDIPSPTRGLLSHIENSSSWRTLLFGLPAALLNSSVDLLARIIPVGVFFLKFLDWWYSEDHSSQAATLNYLPVPPPPPKLKPVSTDVVLPSHPVQCPLCGKARHCATALATSGFVFCYTCAHDYVEEHGKCPLTHFPSTLDDLIRLYPDN